MFAEKTGTSLHILIADGLKILSAVEPLTSGFVIRQSKFIQILTF